MPNVRARGQDSTFDVWFQEVLSCCSFIPRPGAAVCEYMALKGSEMGDSVASFLKHYIRRVQELKIN